MFDDPREFVILPVQQRFFIVGQQVTLKLLDYFNGGNQIPQGNQAEIGYTTIRPNVTIQGPMGPSGNLSPAGSNVGRTQAALNALYSTSPKTSASTDQTGTPK
jgi:hypothetical protein